MANDRSWRVPVIALAGLLVSSCAGLSVDSVKKPGSEADKKARGFRYYQPVAFLFVRSDGKGGLVSEIKWLPDVNDVMSARPYAWLSKNESTLEFSEGTLSKATIVIDETAVPTAALGALAKVLAASAMNTVAKTDEGIIPSPYLFRIRAKGSEFTLRGGPAVGADCKPIEIKVTVPSGVAP